MKKLFSLKVLALAAVFVLTIVTAQIFSARAQVILGGGQLTIICGGGNASNLNVHGKLFSSTIGWIYLNCSDVLNNPTGQLFGVQQDSAGYWNGYGWSSSVGWIKFGGVGCPQHSGWNVKEAAGVRPGQGEDCEVQKTALTGGGYPIVGWARACSATANPATCSGGAGTGSGGWDGWISMSGLNDQNPTAAGLQTSNNYRTTLDQIVPPNGNQPINGNVWGGDVVGWARFYSAYVDTDIVPEAAHLTLTATPVYGNNLTDLKYSIDPAEKAYFTGAVCTATSTPSVGNSWNGARPNFSTTSTAPFEKTVTGAAVPANSVTYTITCPVVVPNSTQTTATASVTVTKASPTITLSVGTHDLCVAGSLGGPQSTTASWIASSPAAKYCRVYRDGTLVADQQDPIGSMPINAFNSPTLSNYVTPTTSGSQHEYVVKCYDSANAQILPESNHEFVGVAPTTFNGATANGNLNCTQADWGITFGESSGSAAVCNAQSSTAASLSWKPWGTVPNQAPNQYTYAVLKKNNNTSGNGSSYTTIGTYDLIDTDSNITAPGYYKVFYYTAGGVVAPISSAQVYSAGQVANTNCFHGLPSGGPYCPTESVNAAAILDSTHTRTYSWSSDAASCNLGGPSGSITITNAPASRMLSCTWPDGSHASNTAEYGPMLSRTDTFCSTPPIPGQNGGNPDIIEN